MPRPCARDGVNASAKREEGDRQAMDENGAEDDESDNRLDGFRQEFGLGFRIATFRVRQLVNGKSGNENGA